MSELLMILKNGYDDNYNELRKNSFWEYLHALKYNQRKIKWN